LRNASIWDLAVEMADVADDRPVLHMPHVVDRDHVDVAGCGDKDVALGGGLVHRRHLVALHRCLQGTDRVDLGDHHAGALAPQACDRALADIAVAA
jgi:hypothetical protein